jgi:hypothetical protein
VPLVRFAAAHSLMPRWGVDSKVLRKATIETLSLLVERYPNLRIGQIIANSNAGANPDLYYIADEELARGLNQLFVTYTQFEAAGIKP